ncbi:MAG: primosomal protein N' [Candidatus Moranbacteria bacterium]|nr:primosomal protein N' [Candidatus Moranbacteria bacterium]
MKGETIYFCDVVPVVPIPLRNRQVFSYFSEEPIPHGSLIWIPFGPRTVRGVVLSCNIVAENTLPSGRFKKIRSVIRESFLTGEQLALVESVSKECLTSTGKTVRHFLPPIVKERTNKGKLEVADIQTIQLAKVEKSSVKEIDTLNIGTSGFLRADLSSVLRIIAGTKNAIGKRKQLLVLVPEIVSLPFAEQFLTSAFGKERLAVIGSRLSSGAYFTAWERIRSGDADIVLGTRQSLFAPFKSLSLIVVIEEAEVLGYKQWDMSPRYDARRVSETLASLHGARLLFTGPIPSLDVSARIDKGTMVEIPANARTGDPDITIVNMREERWKKNYSIISETLRTALSGARSLNGKSVIITSRGGLDSFSVCETCKKVPRCPSCDRSLRSTRDGHLRCPSCSYRTESFPRCESCGSLSFRTVGTGTEKVEREIRRAFPGARVVRLDEESQRSDKVLRSDGLVRSLKRADIIVGTPAVLNVGNLPDTVLVAIMDTDNFLSLPDFRGDERFLHIVAKARNLSSGGTTKGLLILQTFHPERDYFRLVTENSISELLGKTAADRKVLRYPPFSALFKIGIRDKDESAAEKSADDVRKRLSEAAAGLKNIIVSMPIRPLIPKIRGMHTRIILVTVTPYDVFPESLETILASLSGNWFFEPDPLTIL